MAAAGWIRSTSAKRVIVEHVFAHLQSRGERRLARRRRDAAVFRLGLGATPPDWRLGP
jgi:hypothetical protein